MYTRQASIYSRCWNFQVSKINLIKIIKNKGIQASMLYKTIQMINLHWSDF